MQGLPLALEFFLRKRLGVLNYLKNRDLEL